MSGTAFVDAKFFADHVGGHFSHESVGHQFPACNGDEVVNTVTFQVVYEDNSTADVTSLGLSRYCHEGTYTAIGPE